MNQNDYMFKNVEDWEEALGYRVSKDCRIAFNMGRLKWGNLADSIQANAAPLTDRRPADGSVRGMVDAQGGAK
jgi:hypothetical protein